MTVIDMEVRRRTSAISLEAVHSSTWKRAGEMRETVTEPPPAFTAAMLKQAYGCFPSGVLALSGLDDSGVPVGMAVSAFVPVSLDPPLVLMCIQATSTTWPRMRAMPRLGLSVLSQEHGEVARALASRAPNRFEDVQWEANSNGAVFVHGSSLWLETSLESEMPAGDHSVSLLRIRSMESHPDVTPLVFHGSKFRHLQPHLVHENS